MRPHLKGKRLGVVACTYHLSYGMGSINRRIRGPGWPRQKVSYLQRWREREREREREP
jgi:hypothetical protein